MRSSSGGSAYVAVGGSIPGDWERPPFRVWLTGL